MRWIFCAFALVACSPLQCKNLSVDVYPTSKPRPAGRLVVSCDGRALVEAEGATLTVGR